MKIVVSYKILYSLRLGETGEDHDITYVIGECRPKFKLAAFKMQVEMAAVSFRFTSLSRTSSTGRCGGFTES